MRGAPQVGFSLAIRRINCWTPAEIGFLPTGPTLDLSRQYQRKPRRCHATTVSGFKIRSEFFHSDQIRLMTVQKYRSNAVSFGR